ncbi:MAG: aquaporin [Candidatus Colwellbacteria bacterium]|nr:aquaporin [Candidatus Colwellbacteria bacterium]
MLLALLAETIGTALFFIIILSSGKPIEIAIGLLAMMYAFGKVSGGHFNSTISIMSCIKGDMPIKKCIAYICAQLIGMIIALLWYKYGRNYKHIVQ